MIATLAPKNTCEALLMKEDWARCAGLGAVCCPPQQCAGKTRAGRRRSCARTSCADRVLVRLSAGPIDVNVSVQEPQLRPEHALRRHVHAVVGSVLRSRQHTQRHHSLRFAEAELHEQATVITFNVESSHEDDALLPSIFRRHQTGRALEDFVLKLAPFHHQYRARADQSRF